MDVCQQIHQAFGALHPIPCRLFTFTCVYPLWIFPRRNQDVRSDDAQCGKLQNEISLPFKFLESTAKLAVLQGPFWSLVLENGF